MWKKICLFLAIFFIPLAAQAFTLGPDKFFVTADPGAEQEIKIYIKNDEAILRVFKLSVLGASQDGQGRSVFGKGTDIAEAWIVPAEEKVTAQALGTVEGKFLIKIPKSAQPGAHHIGLVAESVFGANGQVGVTAQLASVLTLQVAGEAREILTISNWHPRSNFLFEKELPVEMVLKNEGNVDLSLSGRMEIKSFFGGSVEENKLPIGNNLLAQSSKILSTGARLSDGFLWPGVYRARIEIIYGRLGQTKTVEEIFWYFPKWSFAVAIVILAALFFSRVIKKFLTKTDS